MTTLNTSADIISWALFQAGEPIDGTSDFYTQTIGFLNRAYRDLWTGGGAWMQGDSEPWLWLKKDPPGILTLNPAVFGTASVVNNSTLVTVTTNVTPSMAGRFFKVDDSSDVFRILSHTSGTNIFTLDSVYTGLTSGTSRYKAMQLEYTLASDVQRVIAPMRIYAQNKFEVDGVDLVSLERDFPLAYVDSGAPTRFAVVYDVNGTLKVRFNAYGGVLTTELMRLEYDYLQRPTVELADDSTQPLVPLEHRQVLADLTLYYLFASKADARTQEIGSRAKGGIGAMVKDNQNARAQMSRLTGVILSRPGRLSRNSMPLRTSSGLIIG